MAKYSFQVATWTPTATADGLLTNNAYAALVPGTASQFLNVSEIYMGGQAGASAVNAVVFARSSTLGATPTAVVAPNANGPMTPAFTVIIASPPVGYVTATTAPTRSPTASFARLNLTFNAFGGIVRWVAYPGEEWGMYGTAANVSESSLSSANVGTAGAMGSHIVYEPF